MSPFYFQIKYRKICEETGNICSDWKTVAQSLLDGPYRFNEIKFSQFGACGFQIELPEGFTVATADKEKLVRSIYRRSVGLGPGAPVITF